MSCDLSIRLSHFGCSSILISPCFMVDLFRERLWLTKTALIENTSVTLQTFLVVLAKLQLPCA